MGKSLSSLRRLGLEHIKPPQNSKNDEKTSRLVVSLGVYLGPEEHNGGLIAYREDNWLTYRATLVIKKHSCNCMIIMWRVYPSGRELELPVSLFMKLSGNVGAGDRICQTFWQIDYGTLYCESKGCGVRVSNRVRPVKDAKRGVKEGPGIEGQSKMVEIKRGGKGKHVKYTNIFTLFFPSPLCHESQVMGGSSIHQIINEQRESESRMSESRGCQGTLDRC